MTGVASGMSRTVIALVDDLIFASKIQIAVEQAGASLRRVGTTKALVAALQSERPALVIVDLDGMGFDAVAALSDLRDHAFADGVPRIAFGSHVEPARLEAAREAGASSMPRSAFVRDLPQLVASALGTS